MAGAEAVRPLELSAGSCLPWGRTSHISMLQYGSDSRQPRDRRMARGATLGIRRVGLRLRSHDATHQAGNADLAVRFEHTYPGHGIHGIHGIRPNPFPCRLVDLCERRGHERHVLAAHPPVPIRGSGDQGDVDVLLADVDQTQTCAFVWRGDGPTRGACQRGGATTASVVIAYVAATGPRRGSGVWEASTWRQAVMLPARKSAGLPRIRTKDLEGSPPATLTTLASRTHR